MADKWEERKKVQEDEYFVKKERELVAKLKAKQEAEKKDSAAEIAHKKRLSRFAEMIRNRIINRKERKIRKGPLTTEGNE